MAAQATTIELDFDEGGTVAVDVSAQSRAVSIERGRSRSLDEIDAGRSTITLANADRRFDPLYGPASVTTSAGSVTAPLPASLNTAGNTPTDTVWAGRLTSLPTTGPNDYVALWETVDDVGRARQRVEVTSSTISLGEFDAAAGVWRYVSAPLPLKARAGQYVAFRTTSPAGVAVLSWKATTSRTVAVDVASTTGWVELCSQASAAGLAPVASVEVGSTLDVWRAISCPGISGSRVTVPNGAGLGLFASCSIVVDIAPASWQPATSQRIVDKATGTTGYLLATTTATTGPKGTPAPRLAFQCYDAAGTVYQFLSPAFDETWRAHQREKVGVVIDPTGGPGGVAQSRWYRWQRSSWSWLLIGSTNAASALSEIGGNTAALNVGSSVAGTLPFNGRIFSVELFNGSGAGGVPGGTLQCAVEGATWTNGAATSWVTSTGHTATKLGTASLVVDEHRPVGDVVRFEARDRTTGTPVAVLDPADAVVETAASWPARLTGETWSIEATPAITVGSPFYGQVLPRSAMRIKVGSVVVYTGRVDDWSFLYPVDDDATVTVSCLDGLADLAVAEVGTFTGTAGQASGARVGDVLDLPGVAWTGTRDIDAGRALLQGDTPAATTKALKYLQQIARTEGGLLFVSREGALAFRDRSNVANGIAVAATFDDDPLVTGALRHADVEVRSGASTIWNDITVTRVGGVAQRVENLDSIARYGRRKLQIADVLFSTDAQAQNMAVWLASTYSQPEPRIAALRVKLDGLSDVDQDTVNEFEIGDVVEVRWRPAHVGQQVVRRAAIEALSRQATPSGHVVTLRLADVEARTPLILDSPSLGLLDVNRLGY